MLRKDRPALKGVPRQAESGGIVIVVAITIAIGGASATATVSISSAGASTAISPSSGTRGSGRTSNQNSAAVSARMTRLGLRIQGKYADDSSDCVANSYGQVQQFFRDHPCTSLRRAQFEVRDAKGDVVLVPVAWVTMDTEADAGALKQLVDSSGTGNITELSRQRGRYQTVRYTGDAYASRQDGRVITIAQAQPVARGQVGLALTSIATNAVQ